MHPTPPSSTGSWWLDAAKQLGFPIVMVAVFVAWDAGWIPSQSRSVISQVAVLIEKVGHALSVQQEMRDTLRLIQRRERALCLVFARDNKEFRTACLDDYDGGPP